MNRHFGVARGALIPAMVAFLACATVAGFAQAAVPAPVSGTISSVNGGTIALTLADGTKKDVTINDKTVILERDVATVSDIKAGDAMGVAARRDGTSLVATSINIFAPQMWASPQMRKGQWPMTTGETMTNAEVTDYAVGMNGHTLTMKYQDVNASITVPDGIPIHRLVAVKAGALATGMTISVRGSPAADGKLTAASISYDRPAKG